MNLVHRFHSLVTALSIAVVSICSFPAAASETTAIIVSALHDPVLVKGSDGMDHLEYDLLFTNVFFGPVTLSSVEALAPDGRRLLLLEGDDLKNHFQPMPGDGEPSDELPSSGSGAIVMDVIVKPGEAPGRITHRIKYAVAPNPLDSIIGSTEIDGPELTVSSIRPIVIASPVKGDGWLNANGCCMPSIHRSLRMVQDGLHYIKPETFAIDWIQTRGNKLYDGDGKTNEQYFTYGVDILSVADGIVVSVRDDMEDTPPNTPPTTVKSPGDYAGNHVVVLIQPGVWASYAHLKPGSVTVKEGDKVTTGQVLGRLGSTGNSTAPHLHFGLGDGPDILTSNSLPFVIGSYELVGSVDLDTAEGAFFKGIPFKYEKGSPSGPQSESLQLFFTVADYD